MNEEKREENIEICGTPAEAVRLPRELRTVEAVCINVERIDFRMYRQTKLIFTFEVLEPEEFRGVRLKMYVRVSGDWRGGRPPKSAKLWKIAQIAMAGPRRKGRFITSADFVSKRFKCRLAYTKGAFPYSYIETITELLP